MMDKIIQPQLQNNLFGTTRQQTGSTRTSIPQINFTAILIGLIVFVILVIAVYVFIKRKIAEIKEKNMTIDGLNVVIFDIKVPQNNEVEIKSAEQMFNGLLGIGRKLKDWQKPFYGRIFVSFEIVAYKELITLYVVCPKKIAPLVDRQINGAYPEAQISVSQEYNLFTENGKVAYASLALDDKNYVPINTYEQMSVDTIATLTDSMSKLEEGESVAFQLVISPAETNWRKEGRKYVDDIRKAKNEKDEEGKPKKAAPDVDDDTLSKIEQKVQKNGFYADMRLVSVAQDEIIAKQNLDNMLSSFDQFTNPGGNRLKKVSDVKNFAKDYIYRLPRETMILNTSELATVFHFPNKNVHTPHIQWLLAKQAPAAEFVPSKYEPGTNWVGRNVFRGHVKNIFIKPADRVRHTYVIGQTGTGKSKFMTGMMVRDIIEGRGCCFIDPHGSDTDWILERIPPHRVEDVVYFDPADTGRPMGLNMLEFYNDNQKTFVINEMLSIFDVLYDLKATGGPIFEQYMRNSILLLMEHVESGCTLMEVPKVLADDNYRKFKLSKAKNQEVIDFWTKQAEKAGGEASLQNMVPYITSKLTSFVSNDIMRPIIAQQQSTVDFRDAMDNQKIVLVKLSKGKIGELNASLLGMVIIGKILAAALSRVDIEREEDRKPFYLYIDEFQNFLTDGVNQILAEARKYQLSLTIGHQFIGQLTRKGGDTKIRDSIFGNVGTKICFRVGPDDAKYLASQFNGVFDENDFMKISNGNAYAQMLVDGTYPPPFSLNTFFWQSPYDLITKEGNRSLAELIRNISRLRYGRDREVVETEIIQRGRVKLDPEDAKKFAKPASPMGGLGGGLGGFGAPAKDPLPVAAPASS
jgi:hypothetical protein